MRSFSGLLTCLSVLVKPRSAFDLLRQQPTWGWAALIGIIATLGALLLTEPAQLHVLAVQEAHRIAALPPSARLQERLAVAAVDRIRKPLFIIGAVTIPWITWFLISLFFWIAAAVSRSGATFRLAWVATLNSYVVYGVAGLTNGVLVAIRDPNLVNSGLDLVRLPSLAPLFPNQPQVAAFLTAYNVLNLWYYVVLAIALERVLQLRRPAAAGTVVAYSLLSGFFSALAVGSNQ